MKRILLSALAVTMAVGPMTATNAFAHDNDRDRRGGWDDRRDRDGRWDDRRDRRDRDWRDDRRDNRRWERRHHNGYSYNGRWHYGPPPAAYYNHPSFYAGYKPWRRGDYLPRYYRDRYVVVDYRHHHLRPPPRGYHYVRDDRGDIILAAIATGLIASIILSH
jgi:Ni/Co efflux regulator RcnB